MAVHYIKVDPSSRSISEDASKFLNQITSPHRKTNHTERPFIKVKQYVLQKKTKRDNYLNFFEKNELEISVLVLLLKIQKAFDTVLTLSLSGFLSSPLVPLFVPFYVPCWLEVSTTQERGTLGWQKLNTHIAKTVKWPIFRLNYVEKLSNMQ